MIVPGWVLADWFLQAAVTAYAEKETAGSATAEELTILCHALPAGSNAFHAAGEGEDPCNIVMHARLLQWPEDFSSLGCQLASFHKHQIP